MRWLKVSALALLALHAPAAWGETGFATTAAPSAGDVTTKGAPSRESAIAVAPELLWRWPLRGRLAYPGTTTGWGLDVALPFGDKGLFYHVRAGSLHLDLSEGGYDGFRVVPVGIGTWFHCNTRAPVFTGIDVGLIILALQAEYMSPSRDLPYAGQSSLALGAGGRMYFGTSLGCPLRRTRCTWRIEPTVGVELGVDARYVSLQPAGVATGIGTDLVVLLSVGLRLANGK